MRSFSGGTPRIVRVRLDECQFADDATLLAATHEGAKAYAWVATSFGLTVSYSKTKLMVAGREISDSDTGPLRIGKPVFQDSNLSLHTKRVIYEACVL